MPDVPPVFPARASLVLGGLMVSAPFLNPRHYFPIPSFYTEWLAFALGLAGSAALVLSPARRSIPVPGMSIGLFLLTALLALQVALGQVPYALHSELGALYTIWAGLIVMLGAGLRDELGEPTIARALQWWIALAGVPIAVSGFVQYYHLATPFGTYQASQAGYGMFGTVNQRNHFADYLGCALVSVAFLHARHAWKPVLSSLAVVPVAAGMALSSSRSAWGYMLIIFMLVPLLRRSGNVEEARRVARLTALAFAVFALVQILNSFTGLFAGPEGAPSSSAERLVQDLEMESGAGGQSIRIQLFRYGWLMFVSQPLLGVGFGQYAWHLFDLAATLPGPVMPIIDRHSHNLFLQLLAETGLVGLLCIAVPLAIWLRRTPWLRLSPERCWALAVLAIVGLHSMVEFPLWHSNFLGLFALLLGVYAPASRFFELDRIRRCLAAAVVAAGVFVAVKIWLDYRAFEGWYLGLEAKTTRGGVADRKDLEALMALGEDSVFSPNYERLASEAIEVNSYNLAEKLALNTQVMNSSPMPSVVVRQAALLGLAGRDNEAKRVLVAATRIYPQARDQWLPVLERLAKERPSEYAQLLSAVRRNP